MATLTIRQLDDELYDRLRKQARANNRSLEAEARHILTECANEPGFVPLTKEEWSHKLNQLQARMKDKYGMLPDSTELIREMRDEG